MMMKKTGRGKKNFYDSRDGSFFLCVNARRLNDLNVCHHVSLAAAICRLSRRIIHRQCEKKRKDV
jgi:hypothetical protein